MMPACGNGQRASPLKPLFESVIHLTYASIQSIHHGLAEIFLVDLAENSSNLVSLFSGSNPSQELQTLAAGLSSMMHVNLSANSMLYSALGLPVLLSVFKGTGIQICCMS
jgi:hypothetical protein